mgnify:CR=1 FL=1|tara:strand:- start:132 stop:767 length:636 start_codon:yes stop_codon:yes gene_type:complete
MSDTVKRFESFMTSNCYVVRPNIADQLCYIVDLPPDIEEVFKYVEINNLSIAGVLLTHGHYDHTLGLNKYDDNNVFINLEDEFLARNPKEQFKNLLVGEDIGVDTFEGTLNSVDDITSNDIIITSNPGHTKGSSSFVFIDLGSVFTGDFVFVEGIGRTDLYSGDANEMKESINNIFMNFETDLTVFPGHGRSDTVKQILKYNRYLWDFIND